MRRRKVTSLISRIRDQRRVEATEQLWRSAGGITGPVGPAGDPGRDAGLAYSFDTSTSMADPGSGDIRFNNGTIASVSQIAISDTDDEGNDQDGFLDTWTGGILYIATADGQQITFTVKGVVDQGAWHQVTVVHRSGTLPSNDEALSVLFVPSRGRLYAVHPLLLTPSLYWPFEATYGVNDQSGNARNGTASGGPTAGGFADSPIIGEATCTDFDGSNDKFTSTYAPFVNGATRTWAGWLYRDDTAALHTVFANISGAQLARMYFNSADATTVGFQTDHTSGSGGQTWASAWPGTAQWAHFALIMNESTDTAELFVNGASQGTKTITAAYGGSVGNMVVGAYGGGAGFFNGKMAHFGVWERALTAAEIRALYFAGL